MASNIVLSNHVPLWDNHEVFFTTEEHLRQIMRLLAKIKSEIVAMMRQNTWNEEGGASFKADIYDSSGTPHDSAEIRPQRSGRSSCSASVFCWLCTYTNRLEHAWGFVYDSSATSGSLGASL